LLQEHKRDPWFFNSGGEGSDAAHYTRWWKSMEKITEDDGFPRKSRSYWSRNLPNKPNIILCASRSKEKNALYKVKMEVLNGKWSMIKVIVAIRFVLQIYVDPQMKTACILSLRMLMFLEDGGKTTS
jgi:hypothetical protein